MRIRLGTLAGVPKVSSVRTPPAIATTIRRWVRLPPLTHGSEFTRGANPRADALHAPACKNFRRSRVVTVSLQSVHQVWYSGCETIAYRTVAGRHSGSAKASENA